MLAFDLLTLTAFVASFVVGLLHGIVPLFLVSITDAIGATDIFPFVHPVNR